jgi:hypothetical protein
MYNYYETNTVWITLNNGVNQPVAYNTGLHPLRNQFVLGPMRWNMSALGLQDRRIDRESGTARER